MIVVTAGLPGSGKSALAEALAKQLGGIVVSKDVLRDAAFGALVDYSTGQDDFCMELVFRVVCYLHETRPELPVIVDGRTFSRRAQVERALLALPEAPRFIECACEDEVAKKRLEAAPEHLARNRNFELYCRVKAATEPLQVERLTIDTGTIDLVEAVRRASEYVMAPSPHLAGS